MPYELTHTIEIACAPGVLYRYVTQPWRWHEWHPNSLSASAEVETLGVGDSFDEVIEIQPLSPLPFRLRRETRYTVLLAEPFERWQVRGETRDGWLELAYELAPSELGTRFRRSLRYQARGPTALLLRLMGRRMDQLSRTALERLKARVQAGGTA